MGWINIKDRLPDENTRYAGKYGVSVLYYDEDEANDSGYFTPYICSFKFDKQIFLIQVSGLNDPEFGDWLPADLSHWQELPEAPEK